MYIYSSFMDTDLHVHSRAESCLFPVVSNTANPNLLIAQVALVFRKFMTQTISSVLFMLLTSHTDKLLLLCALKSWTQCIFSTSSCLWKHKAKLDEVLGILSWLIIYVKFTNIFVIRGTIQTGTNILSLSLIHLWRYWCMLVHVVLCVCAGSNAGQQKRTQCCSDWLCHADVRRIHRHQRVLTRLLAFGFW